MQDILNEFDEKLTLDPKHAPPDGKKTTKQEGAMQSSKETRAKKFDKSKRENSKGNDHKGGNTVNTSGRTREKTEKSRYRKRKLYNGNHNVTKSPRKLQIKKDASNVIADANTATMLSNGENKVLGTNNETLIVGKVTIGTERIGETTMETSQDDNSRLSFEMSTPRHDSPRICKSAEKTETVAKSEESEKKHFPTSNECPNASKVRPRNILDNNRAELKDEKNITNESSAKSKHVDRKKEKGNVQKTDKEEKGIKNGATRRSKESRTASKHRKCESKPPKKTARKMKLKRTEKKSQRYEKQVIRGIEKFGKRIANMATKIGYLSGDDSSSDSDASSSDCCCNCSDCYSSSECTCYDCDVSFESARKICCDSCDTFDSSSSSWSDFSSSFDSSSCLCSGCCSCSDSCSCSCCSYDDISEIDEYSEFTLCSSSDYDN
ncbi:PREDICTED: suppressor protein SRP40-like isoform X2 [Dufourea novaeangliae]|nr:PREDICTED: suppressor protein SRP40-like isoform X2 [Dufourea novaeangliae]XP_015434100.1 PREDICTED: suppressor protein SRP40-like isoform X2 [Dufourea novaeangliae]